MTFNFYDKKADERKEPLQTQTVQTISGKNEKFIYRPLIGQ